MKVKRTITTRLCWDRDAISEKELETGESVARHLLLEVTAPEQGSEFKGEKPVNLALVIDRSGSMARGRLSAACQAAENIVETLGKKDRLALVVFDNEVEVLEEGLGMNALGQERIKSALSTLHPRGSTNLAGGWFEGTRCVAEGITKGWASEGRVLILSDGRANNGICDPQRLLGHARSMANRKVMTSAVGIGDDYSPLQLDALVEGGRGRLHDAATPKEIVEVVTGELGEMRAVAALDVIVRCMLPVGLIHDVKIEGLSIQGCEGQEGSTSFSLGEIPAGDTRALALRVEWPVTETKSIRELQFEITWQDPQSPDKNRMEVVNVFMAVIPTEQAGIMATKIDIATKIADLWEAALAYRSLRYNDKGNYSAAMEQYRMVEEQYLDLVEHLPDEEERRRRFSEIRIKVSQDWQGRSKRQAFALSKKAMLMEKDLRKVEQGQWYEQIEKQ